MSATYLDTNPLIYTLLRRFEQWKAFDPHNGLLNRHLPGSVVDYQNVEGRPKSWCISAPLAMIFVEDELSVEYREVVERTPSLDRSYDARRMYDLDYGERPAARYLVARSPEIGGSGALAIDPKTFEPSFVEAMYEGLMQDGAVEPLCPWPPSKRTSPYSDIFSAYLSGETFNFDNWVASPILTEGALVALPRFVREMGEVFMNVHGEVLPRDITQFREVYLAPHFDAMIEKYADALMGIGEVVQSYFCQKRLVHLTEVKWPSGERLLVDSRMLHWQEEELNTRESFTRVRLAERMNYEAFKPAHQEELF